MPSDWAKAQGARFHAKLTPAEAMDALWEFGADTANHGGDRLQAASAMMDLRTGRSVQSTLSRFRRAIGADPQPKRKPS